MPLDDYLVGTLFAVTAIGAPAAAAGIVVIRRGRALPPGVAVAAWGLLTVTGVFVAHLAPGVLGILSREAAAASGIAVLGAALLVPAAGRVERHEPPPPGDESRVSWALGIGTIALAASYALGLVVAHAGDFPVSPDTVTFHLPNIARWMQSGSVWQVDDWVPNKAFGSYPQSGDILHLAAVLPWKRDFLIPLINLPLTGLAALAVFCCAREIRAGTSAALLVTGALVAAPVVGYLTWTGLADHTMYATFACGVLFLVRHARTGDSFELVLAAAGLGLSFGTRWYAVPAVLAVVLVWGAAWLLARRPVADLVRSKAAIAAVGLPLGGFWLVRNWVETGNPLFPVKVEVGGHVLFDAPPDTYRELHGFSLSHYLDEPDVWWDVIGPTYVDLLSVTPFLLVAGALAAGGLVAATGRAKPTSRAVDARVAATAAAVLLIVVAYVFTPYSASGDPGDPHEGWVNTRYVVPAVLIATAGCAWLITRAARLRIVLELALVAAAVDALRRGFSLGDGEVATAGLLLGAAAVAAVGVLLARIPARAWGWRRLATVAATAFAVTLVLGAVHADRYGDGWYRDFSPVIDYVRSEAPRGARIGIVGDGFSNYPLFGQELDNEVEYIGERVQEMLRPLKDRPRFIARLRERDYDLVYVHRLDTLHAAFAAPQERWLGAGGYRRVADGVHPILGTEIALYAR